MKYAALAIVVIVLIVGGVYLLNSKNSNNKATQSTNTQQVTVTKAPENSTPSTESAQMSKTVIKLTDSGFTPSEVTIKKGESVTFENDSNGKMWVASNVHPIHSEYDGTTLREHCAAPTATTFDECKGEPRGTSFTFTFTKVGKWSFHNHANPSDFGSVIVQ